MLPAFWLFWQGVSGGLGPDPAKALEHEYGALGLKFLIATLTVTPLRRLVGLNLLKFRRLLGLVTFFYITAHLLVWLLLDVQWLSLIWADIVKRPYVTLGMAGFLVLVPLALTSNAWSIRRLGPRWHRLHRLTYVAAILGALHFALLEKGFPWEPLAYGGGIAVLLGLRIWWRRPKTRRNAATA